MEITREDIFDLKSCGSVGNWFCWHKLFYDLKDLILLKYGYFTGYDEQNWNDDGWDYEEEVYATHSHILKRYVLVVGNQEYVFHIPTNEYSYFNYAYQDGKQSNDYSRLVAICRNKIEGKKKYSGSESSIQIAKKSLKNLLLKFGYLYKENKNVCTNENK
jgi:hypothetical protein